MNQCYYSGVQRQLTIPRKADAIVAVVGVAAAAVVQRMMNLTVVFPNC